MAAAPDNLNLADVAILQDPYSELHDEPAGKRSKIRRQLRYLVNVIWVRLRRQYLTGAADLRPVFAFNVGRHVDGRFGHLDIRRRLENP